MISGQYGNTGCGVFKGEIQNKKYFWLKINCSQIKLLNFENRSSGELSQIGHLKTDLSKNVNNKKCTPKIVLFNEKKVRKICRKLTLKVRFWHFLTPPHHTNLKIWKIQWFHLTTVDFYPKTFLILYPSHENFTYDIANVYFSLGALPETQILNLL